MTPEDFKYLSLPKWPCLLVVGQDVTREQAEHILLRTEQWYGGNDRSWNTYWRNELKARGFVVNDTYISTQENLDKGCIPLEYLHNSRISSAWVFGPKGWCDWDGKIFTDNYNIGKWPSVAEVFEEWKVIAKAFPYLNLTAQLLSGEAGEKDLIPLIEFHIKDGEVTLCEPKTMLITSDYRKSSVWSGSRGCSRETLDRALQNVFGNRKV